MNYLFISSLWIAYCILHSFLISISFTNFVKRLLGRYYAFYRLFYVVVSIYLLILLINYSNQFESGTVINNEFPFTIIRFSLLIISLVIFFWAFFFSYDPLSFFGIRQIINLNKMPDDKHPASIKKNGLLAYMRHPMYFALIIFLLCTTITLLDLIINFILIIYVLIGTVLEEKKLILEFGEQYKNYQLEVPMLIPFSKNIGGLTLHHK